MKLTLPRVTSLLAAWLYFTCPVQPAQLAEPGFIEFDLSGYRFSLPSRDSIIDYRLLPASPGDPGSRDYLKVLTRDRDGVLRIFVIDSGEVEAAARVRGPRIASPHRVTPLPAGLAIDSREVPIHALKASCEGSDTYWMVLALRLTGEGPLETLLYVFREEGSTYELLLRHGSDQGLGDMERVIFRDIDGDCLPELFYVDRSHSLSAVTVFVLGRGNELVRVQRIEPAGRWEVTDLPGQLSFRGWTRMGVGEAGGGAGLCWEAGAGYLWNPQARELVAVPHREEVH